MRILGIETSCDETAVALVTGTSDKIEIEKSLVASQAEIHAKYGGVVPEIAARSHVDVIFPLLVDAGVPHDGKGIDAIAVTAGPGLVPALRVGVEVGKALAWLWKKPLVAVNHLEGHIYSVWFEAPQPAFPALTLLVSGGHTELILMKNHGEYELLGMTRDDAAGEAFDKVAKLLGLGYPGGPAISKMAEKGNPEAIAFPRPMIDEKVDFSAKGGPAFGWSFAGLKTAVAVRHREQPNDLHEDVCASFQAAVIDVLVTKTLRAMDRIRPASLIISGGVAANTLLRETLGQAIHEKFPDTTFHVPNLRLTGDNAAMIAAAGYFRARQKDFVDPLTLVADPHMRLAV